MLSVTTPNPEISTYPGEYISVQHKFETLPEELLKLHEGASGPAHNICETPEYYKIELAAPGLRRDDFLVNINEYKHLSISALHKEPDKIESEKYQKHTFNYECFNCEFLLPENIDTYFVKAEYRAGILSLCFLKTERPYQQRDSIVIVY